MRLYIRYEDDHNTVCAERRYVKMLVHMEKCSL